MPPSGALYGPDVYRLIFSSQCGHIICCGEELIPYIFEGVSCYEVPVQSRSPAISMDLTSYEMGHFPKMYDEEVVTP